MTRRSGTTDTALPRAAGPEGAGAGRPGSGKPGSGKTRTPKPRKAAPAANPDAFLESPEHVTGYRDLTQIGYGGFSVVYRAVQESVDRAVALKVLTVAGPDEDAQRRFDREVRLAGKLSNHPHVVTVLDTGTTASGRPFLAMDLYDGGSMKEWLARQGTLAPAQAALLGAKIADALAAAHELGVLHRDVKPNNILVSRYGEPALADFGVSCLLDSSASGSVLDIFSPQHAAPELMTRGVPSVASDIYALGSSLYELLMGKPPFGGNGQDVRATMFRTVSEPAPRADCPGMPGLAIAIERAMAKEPHDRFPDAAAFARALRALIPDGGASGALVLGDVREVLDIPVVRDVRDVPGPRRQLPAEGGHPAVTGPAPISPVADVTDEMYVYSASDHYVSRPDDTMVRPDRAERPERVSGSGGRRGGKGGGPGGGRPDRGERGDRADRVDRADRGDRTDRGAHGGEPRSRKPLVIVAGVALVAGAVWAVASQGSATPRNGAAADAVPPTATSTGAERPTTPHATTTSSASHSSSSSTPSATRHSSSSSAPSHAPASSTAVASAPVPPPATAPTTAGSSGPQLPGNYHRFRNAQSGDCLTQPAGSGTAGAQGCAGDRTQGWEYSVPLTGILGAVTGQFELANGASGQCLTGGGGPVSVRSCTGSASQIWTRTGGGTEFQNVGDGQCLKTAQGAVTEGPCGAGDAATQWTDAGTV